ncbi:MAG: AAA-like domain-containing protein [Verrucomicrobiia bacterium]
MSAQDATFYITGGTLQADAPSYVERRADQEVCTRLLQGQFCYVLTSRQMGKSSLMVRTAVRLRRERCEVVAVDLTAIGLNLTSEQWYDGLLLRMARQLRLEDELEDYWADHQSIGPVQRLFCALREVVLGQVSGQLVIFIDEIDTVRSLPFSSDEFFAAIRECYNRRSEDSEFNRLTFCLLGVATPSELIRNTRTTPFNIGHRIELTDFTLAEGAPLGQRLSRDEVQARELVERIFDWTHGHPYLTQRLCRAVAEFIQQRKAAVASAQTVDSLCETLFLSPRAREQDDNLLFVRERLLRTELDLARLLGLYEQVLKGERVPDDETDELINQLRLAGIVDVSEGFLRVRNQIYARVFDEAWVAASVPDAELQKPGGGRIRLRGTCTIGRGSTSDIVLNDSKVSRRHALIQPQKQYEFWLLDLGSSNGTYVNGRRISQPVLLRDRDQIELGPFRLVFRQSKNAGIGAAEGSNADQTIFAERVEIETDPGPQS